MSEVKLNLIDSQTILAGTIHGSIGDLCVAALSAEPETIAELETAMERFEKEPPNFHSCFISERSEIDGEPYDAGILIIDLAARIVAQESTYSMPGPQGHVDDPNGQYAAPIFYQIPQDWLFLDSVEEYESVCVERRNQRLSKPPLDARVVLYGRPLLEFLAENIRHGLAFRDVATYDSNGSNDNELTLSPIAAIHAQWLLTPREDLHGQSPRDVMLAKQRFIDADLQSRSLQWSMQLEGPQCLARDSFAYRFAGFGSHEWVLYYDLIRHLLNGNVASAAGAETDFEVLVSELELEKDRWLNEPNVGLDDRVPAIIIDNERKRLPEAMGGRSMVVDEECPLCKMMGDECEAGLDVCFWHLDGCNMDEHFAFSTFLTEKHYLEELIQRDLRHREFDEKWKEREPLISPGEELESYSFVDPSALDEFLPFALTEPEPPES